MATLSIFANDGSAVEHCRQFRRCLGGGDCGCARGLGIRQAGFRRDTRNACLIADVVAAPLADGTIERGATNRPASNSLLEQAEIAFAAGRIIEPEFDNALNYYRSLLETEPDNKDAANGVDRVIAYLENQAEGAVFQNDWDAARAYAAVILNVHADDTHARDLRARVNRLERVQTLTAKALAQVRTRQPRQPEGRQRGRFLSRDPRSWIPTIQLRRKGCVRSCSVWSPMPNRHRLPASRTKRRSS